jgi:hypothetical protein
MSKQLSMFNIPDDRDGIVFNGENAYNVERWVRDRAGHASMIAKPTPEGIVRLMRIAQGDLVVHEGDTIIYADGEFSVE